MVVGGVAATVDFVMFAIAVKAFAFHWFPSAFASFVAATAVKYALSIRHVFESGVRFRRRNEVLLVFLVSGVGLAINQTILWLLIESVALNVLIAKVLATATVFFWNYGLRRAYIFKPL
jgi:putative flippase GtrA